MSKKSNIVPAQRRKTVFLVDRHAVMRRAAADWVNRCSGLTICGIAGRTTSAFEAIRRLHPDLVVSEIMQPQDLGFIRELHQRHPQIPILVFTVEDAAVYAARARRAGASGYVMKEAGGEELIRNILAVLSRQKWKASRTVGERGLRHPRLALAGSSTNGRRRSAICRGHSATG